MRTTHKTIYDRERRMIGTIYTTTQNGRKTIEAYAFNRETQHASSIGEYPSKESAIAAIEQEQTVYEWYRENYPIDVYAEA